MKNLADEAKLNEYRVRDGVMGSDESIGNYGVFHIPISTRMTAQVVVDGGAVSGWEHVSVSIRCMLMDGSVQSRTPTWREMCRIKDMFWDAEDVVVQYHPPAANYVNNHPHVLHLWRPLKEAIPMPPTLLIGINEIQYMEVPE